MDMMSCATEPKPPRHNSTDRSNAQFFLFISFVIVVVAAAAATVTTVVVVVVVVVVVITVATLNMHLEHGTHKLSFSVMKI